MHTTFIATALVTAFAPASGETGGLVDQPLASFEDSCETQGRARVRHVRFATVDPAGRIEDRLELRTTTWTPSSAQVQEYLVGDVVLFVQPASEPVQPTPAGLGFLRAGDGARVSKILTAFAAAHPRIFAADVQAPQHSCGAWRGPHEEKGKCAGIAALGCLPKIAAICLASIGAGYLCNYLVDKTCDENPDSCQPGWTTGE